MNRRHLLIYCGITASIGGCLEREADSVQSGETESRNGESDAESANNDSEGGDGSPSHVITVSEPTTDIDEGSARCRFDDLPPGAQEEVTSAIDDLQSDADETGRYATSERPALLDTDCYAAYIRYENRYYFTGVDALGG
ncbi:hypothetical protein [Halorubrum sp. LN27]|uniref:hypothetical protein n=1 Tax=Halorubrum sp. LN27 TaxID=2801032 RepID=UPI00190D7A05|nr:hypothetical protein [Halorubrum sp. LN27]